MSKWLLAALMAASAAEAAPSDGFERVFPSVYRDLISDAFKAYDGKRYDEAFPLIKRAACAGDKHSQWALGSMYLLGQGTARDDLEGYGWLKTAAEFDWASYRTTVKKIEDALEGQQRAAATAVADRIRANYGIRATQMSCNKAASQHGHIQDTIRCTPKDDGSMVLLRQCIDAPAADAKSG